VRDLVPNPRNPKGHDLETLDASVKRFGFIEPVVPDGRTGQIIAGHGRAETLRNKELRGDDLPEGLQVDDDGAWLIPTVVGWSSRDDLEAEAALVALNQTSMLGGWVDEALLATLDQLATVDDGLAGVGFDDEDVDDLRARLEEVENSFDADASNTRVTPSLDDYRDLYEQQGRRLIVLEFGAEEYGEVTEGLHAWRDRFGVDTNSAAVLAALREGGCGERDSDAG
jgi:ParB/Sulfiredoxin domain